jgi:hypothetical protein
MSEKDAQALRLPLVLLGLSRFFEPRRKAS